MSLLFKWLLLILSLVGSVQCQDARDFENPAVRGVLNEVLYTRLQNVTTNLYQDLGDRFSYCVTDP